MRHGAAFTAFFDANVLYPFQLRDLIMRLALRDLFRAKWSAAVHDEWIAAVQRNNPDISPAKLQQTRGLMDAHARDALVSGYDYLLEPFAKLLPDPTDAHVLAAAAHGRADVIVTANVRDFPAEVLDRFQLHAQHPDEFIAHLIDLDTARAISAVHDARQALLNPPRSVDEFLSLLERAGLPQTVALLRPFGKLF